MRNLTARRERAQAALRTGLAGLAAFSQPLLFTPFWLFIGNKGQFGEPLTTVLLTSAAIMVVGMVPIIALAAFGPNAIRGALPRILLAAALLLWVQSSFLAWDFGPFDGTRIQWTDFVPQALVELTVWGVIIIAIWLARARIDGLVVAISCALLGAQVVFALPIAVVSGQWSRVPPRLRAPPPELFDYSSGLNIVHVFIDSLRTDAFLKIVKSDPALAEAFRGFTVYEENITPHSYTWHTFPSVFIGHSFDGKTLKDSDDFRGDYLIKNGMLGRLKEAGLDVNLTISRHSIFQDFPKYTAYLVPERSGDFFLTQKLLPADFITLLDASIFRVLPIVAKAVVFTEDGQLFRSASLPELLVQLRFLDLYIKQLTVVDDKPRYHFIYTLGAHPPYVVDQTGKESSIRNEAEAYIAQATWVLHRVGDLLKKLQELGIYDRAGIIIHGDHGISHGGINYLGDDRRFERKMERAMAALAVKEPNSQHPLALSSAPTTLTDIPATILSWAGMEEAGYGRPISSIQPGEDRIRTNVPDHFIYTKNIMSIYEVRGSLYEPSSWRLKEERLLK